MYEIIYHTMFSHAFLWQANVSALTEKAKRILFSLSVLYAVQNKSNLKIIQGLELFRFNLVQR